MQRRRRCTDKGGISLFEKEISLPLTHPEKIPLPACSSKGYSAWGMIVPCVAALLRSPPLVLLYDLTCSYLRCRSADLASVQTNHLLPMAQQRGERSNAALVGTCRIDNIRSRRRLLKTNESQAERQRIIEATQIVLKHHLAGTRFRRLSSSSSPRLPMRGSRGTPLACLWGIKRGYSLRKENTPFVPCSAVGAALPPRGAGNVLTNKQICPLEA